MKKILNSNFVRAAGIRALKTMAQTALGMFTIGAALNEVQWTYVISVSFVAGVYSILTSIATNLPEVGDDGTFVIGEVTQNEDGEDVYSALKMIINKDLTSLSKRRTVTMKVDNPRK